MDPADFVLGKFRSDERAPMDVAVYRAADVVASFIPHGGDPARQYAGELND